MKLIALHRHPSQPVATFPDLDIIPDSAITIPGRGPIFIPDFAQRWRGSLMIGLRISRLGKGMEARFASRYYDAMTLILRLRPEPELSFPGALASAFDGCIGRGEWFPIPSDPSEPLTITAGDLAVTLTPEELAFDRAVAAAGRYLTLRDGDILASATLPVDFPLVSGDIIEASIGGQPCLRQRLK